MRDVRIMDEQTTVFDRIEDLILLLVIIVVFLLKLLNVIKIPWFWLFSIIWIPCGLMIVFLIFAGLMGAGLAIYDKIKEKKDERN